MEQRVEEVIHEGRPPLRGEVIGPRSALDPDTRLEDFYVGVPVYSPDELRNARAPMGRSSLWLVQLFPVEAYLAAMHGGEALEELLIQYDPDVTDWRRPPLPVISP